MSTNLELINQIFQVCIVPLLAVLTTYLVKYIEEQKIIAEQKRIEEEKSTLKIIKSKKSITYPYIIRSIRLPTAPEIISNKEYFSTQ